MKETREKYFSIIIGALRAFLYSYGFIPLYAFILNTITIMVLRYEI